MNYLKLDSNGRSSDMSSAQGLKRTISNFEDEIPDRLAPKTKKVNIMTETLAAALDRTRTSSRSATHILAAAATSLGCNIDNINLSSSAIHRNRIRIRKDIAKDLKDNLQFANCLVVHWDGKLLPELVGKGKVERLPIVLSGLGTEQLLGVPKLNTGSGVNQATAIIETLTDWNIIDRVKAMCFDTTSSNTGILSIISISL